VVRDKGRLCVEAEEGTYYFRSVDRCYVLDVKGGVHEIECHRFSVHNFLRRKPWSRYPTIIEQVSLLLQVAEHMEREGVSGLRIQDPSMEVLRWVRLERRSLWPPHPLFERS
jgi:hypothetical protein